MNENENEYKMNRSEAWASMNKIVQITGKRGKREKGQRGRNGKEEKRAKRKRGRRVLNKPSNQCSPRDNRRRSRIYLARETECESPSGDYR